MRMDKPFCKVILLLVLQAVIQQIIPIQQYKVLGLRKRRIWCSSGTLLYLKGIHFPVRFYP